MENDIPAPIVPLANAEGFISVSDLHTDIPVHIKVLPDAAPFDSYQLLLNGQSVGQAFDLPDPAPKAGATLIMMLDNDKLTDADHYLISYRLKAHHGAVEVKSVPALIRIDRTKTIA